MHAVRRTILQLAAYSGTFANPTGGSVKVMRETTECAPECDAGALCRALSECGISSIGGAGAGVYMQLDKHAPEPSTTTSCRCKVQRPIIRFGFARPMMDGRIREPGASRVRRNTQERFLANS